VYYHDFSVAHGKYAFYQKLSGVFEVRIYPEEYSRARLRAISQVTPEAEADHPSMIIEGVDILKLREALAGVDNAMIQKRRLDYSRVWYEAILSQEQGKGISFTSMLLLLAHHKLIDDREALV
jgi:hypothetical protein